MKKRTIFVIILISFAFASLLELAQNGSFSHLTETTAEAPSSGSANQVTDLAETHGKININSASATTLDTLEGIGEEYAGRIIKYRDETGAFEVIQDIMKVPGIGEKRFLKIKDKISVE